MKIGDIVVRKDVVDFEKGVWYRVLPSGELFALYEFFSEKNLRPCAGGMNRSFNLSLTQPIS